MIMFFVIIGGDLNPTDKDISNFLCPEPVDQIFKIDNTSLEELACMSGIFNSKGLARKNGLFGDIPHGISFIGTKKRRFWVWNPNQLTSDIRFDRSFDHTKKYFS
jgi:hypothetical protein